MESNDKAITEYMQYVLAGAEPDKVAELEAELLNLPQVQIEVSHVFHAGMVARTIKIPAGLVLTGAYISKDNISTVNGDLTLATENGPLRLTGYHVLPAKAGYKRCGISHELTYWTTFFRSNATTIEEFEREITPQYQQLQTNRLALEVAA